MMTFAGPDFHINKKNCVSLQDALDYSVESGIPGVSAAVGIDGEIVWQGTAGYSDILRQVPVKTKNCFGIGSITKTFVAQTTLQLVQERTLDLESYVCDCLDASILDGIANTDTAVIRQLLNHQSGIPDWEVQPDWIRKARGVDIDPGRKWAKAESLEYVRGLPADFEPGKCYVYSNTNYTLLGLVIESVTGNDLTHEIRQRLLIPLNMKNTGFESFEKSRDSLVHHYHIAVKGYYEAAGKNPALPEVRNNLIETSSANLSAEWAAGGMVSSPQDLMRWASAVRSGELLLPEIRPKVFEYTEPREGSKAEEKYMMGVLRIPGYFHGCGVTGHGGATLGFTARMYWLEPYGVTVVLLTNLGEIHAGISPSPTGVFYKEILLPSVFKTLNIRTV